MISIKKSFAILLFLLVIGSSLVYAALIPTEVILNQNLTITYNDEIQRFKNVNGEVVYPISYAGTTYLPIRSISCLFKTGIQWDGNTNSIYLGSGDLDTIAAESIPEFIAGTNQTITTYLNEDIKIYHSGEVQTFKDVNGKIVYPLSYNGTTYLPVRAISNLYNANIEWVAETSTVAITKNENITFEGKYISNVDGYTEVVLTPNEEGVNFYLRGNQLGADFAANVNASISGDTGVYEIENYETNEMDKFEFKIVNSKLIITVTNEEYKCFEGEYLLDDGSINTIVLTNPNSLSGTYEKENVKLELIEFNDGTLDASFTGSYSEDGFFFTGAVLDYENGIATYENDEFDYVEKINMQIDGDTIVVEASSTEEDSTYQYIGGTYKFVEKKVWDFETCKQQAEEIEVTEDSFIY